ncbi:AAA family ATPase [Dactylosporangium sp. NPDC049525]|uniref:AAA family ATPase n=1 Tax=Dactylosporangium sp. NPDC049525 TaxID=3154730 RepID=UPI00342D16DA
MSQSQRFHQPSSTRPPVAVSERLAPSLRTLGAAGKAWLAGLPGLLADLEADWSVTVGAGLDGGRAAYVAEAVTHDGTPVVLKVSIPPGVEELTPFDRQLTALRVAGGDPYVRLLRHDAPRQALLLERLGPPMASLRWPAARQLDALARTAARGWRRVPAGARLPTGAEAARWHAGFIASAWEELARPCPREAVDLALRCTAAREAAADPGRAVLVHGDVHNHNALRVPSGAGFRLVDPGGLASEPAHDLGVIQARGVQGWIDELATTDPQRALERMARGCRHAGRLTGVDPQAIWQWAFTELLSTGLFVLRLGDHEAAASFLAVAGKLAAATAETRPRPVRRAPATLLLMVGLPGAGKTTRAIALAEAYRALRLTPDEWMIPLFGEPEAGGKRDVLEGRLITVALRMLRLGTNVVLDFGLWGRDERSALRWLATAAGATCRVVYLPVDADVQRARIAHRHATAPQTTFPMTDADIDAWRAQFQVPDAAELRGGAIPDPPPDCPGWPQWAADRWPSLDPT